MSNPKPEERHAPAFPPGIDVAFIHQPFGLTVWEAEWTHIPRKHDHVWLNSERYVVIGIEWRQELPHTRVQVRVMVEIAPDEE